MVYVQTILPLRYFWKFRPLFYPGMSLGIKIDGTAQETVTVNLNDLARYYLFGLDDGDYTVSLFRLLETYPLV